MQNAGLARYQWLRRYDLCREQFTRGAMSCRDAPPIPHSCARTVRCALCGLHGVESSSLMVRCLVRTPRPSHTVALVLCDVRGVESSSLMVRYLVRTPRPSHTVALVLCVVHCALCVVSISLCSLCCELYAIRYMLCAVVVPKQSERAITEIGNFGHTSRQSRSYCVLCVVCCALCVVHCALCAVLFVLCSCCTLCTLFFVQKQSERAITEIGNFGHTSRFCLLLSERAVAPSTQ